MTNSPISEAVYAHYNAHYSNVSYRAVTDCLQSMRHQDPRQYGENYYLVISNLLLCGI